MKTVLIIEDQLDLLEGLKENLGGEGFRVLGATSGEVGLELASEQGPDVIVLDVMLPGMDGFEVCRKLRARGIRTPIIFLSARSTEIDRVLGLEIGANDYVTKPFSLRELVARIRARLRERDAPASDGPKTVSFESVVIDFEAHTATRDGEALQLTPREFELLRVLVTCKGEVVSRARLLREVFGYHEAAGTRTIDTHILNLRQKLEPDPANPRHIRTVYGLGYRFFE